MALTFSTVEPDGANRYKLMATDGARSVKFILPYKWLVEVIGIQQESYINLALFLRGGPKLNLLHSDCRREYERVKDRSPAEAVEIDMGKI